MRDTERVFVDLCRQELSALEAELAIAEQVFEHPTVGGGVAPAIYRVMLDARRDIREVRLQAMLCGAAWRLNFRWEQDGTFVGKIKWVDISTAAFLLDGPSGLRPVPRQGKPLKFGPIERVVLVALWSQIPRELWPDDLAYDPTTISPEDATEATQSADPVLRQWMIIHGTHYLPDDAP